MAQENLVVIAKSSEIVNQDAVATFTRIYDKIVLTLENSLIPPEKLENTPSRLDGLDAEVEKDLRILGCELIQTAGILLKLPQVAMATGQVLFQRFFYSKSFVIHNMETVAMSCIYLASKIEEGQRRIRDVINVFNHIKQVRAQKEITPLILDQYYTNLKNQVIKAERRVLKELGFCVHVKHPHKLIVLYLQVLQYEKNEQIMQMSWNFMNDSLRTDVFMRYQPETIACACIYLSARRLSIALPTHPQPWYGIFNVCEDDIIDICYRVMDLYRRPKANVEKLESVVEELKKQHYELRSKTKEVVVETPSTTVAPKEKTNGSHNAWGGFIQRTIPEQNTVLPVKNNEEKPPLKKSRTPSKASSSSSSRSSSRSSSSSTSQSNLHRGRRDSKKSGSKSDISSESTSHYSSVKHHKRSHHDENSTSSATSHVKKKSNQYSPVQENLKQIVDNKSSEQRKRKSPYRKHGSGNERSYGKRATREREQDRERKEKYQERERYHEREKHYQEVKYAEREKHYAHERYSDREKYNEEKHQDRDKYYGQERYQERVRRPNDKYQSRDKHYDEKTHYRDKYYGQEKYSKRTKERGYSGVGGEESHQHQHYHQSSSSKYHGKQGPTSEFSSSYRSSYRDFPGDYSSSSSRRRYRDRR